MAGVKRVGGGGWEVVLPYKSDRGAFQKIL